MKNERQNEQERARNKKLGIVSYEQKFVGNNSPKQKLPLHECTGFLRFYEHWSLVNMILCINYLHSISLKSQSEPKNCW